MYSSSSGLHKRKSYSVTANPLLRPKLNSTMRFKPTRNSGAYTSGISSPDSKMKKTKGTRKYGTTSSRFGDTKRKLENFTDLAYAEAVTRLRVLLNESYNPKSSQHIYEDSGDEELDDRSVFSNFSRLSRHYHAPIPYMKREVAVPKTDSKEPPTSELMTFIERQEDYINQLEKESQYCRNELAGLLDKVKEVIAENEQLHKRQKLGLFKSINDNVETETDEDPYIENTSKSSVITTKPLEGPAIVFESRISELEAQLTQTKIDLKKAQDENSMLQRQIAENLSNESPVLKNQIKMLQKDKENLQEQISKLQMNASLNSSNNVEDKSQAELARWERERTEAKLRRVQAELQRVNDSLAEQSRRFANEKDALERRYTQQIDQLNSELAVQWDTASKLQLELDKQRREISDLRRELAQKNVYIEDLKKDLQNKTVTLQSEQSQSTAEKCSLEQELANARLAADCSERAHKQECARLNAEITSLRQRLDRADADALHLRRENMRLSERIASLEKELNINKMLSEDYSTPATTSTAISKDKLPIMALPPPAETPREKELTSMVKNIEAKHEATVAELEGMIQSQNALMEKLTAECHSLTQKLEESSIRHKNEIAKLQNSIRYLNSKLEETYRKDTESYFPSNEQHSMHTVPERYSSKTSVNSNNSDIQYEGDKKPKAIQESPKKYLEKFEDLKPSENYTNYNVTNDQNVEETYNKNFESEAQRGYTDQPNISERPDYTTTSSQEKHDYENSYDTSGKYASNIKEPIYQDTPHMVTEDYDQTRAHHDITPDQNIYQEDPNFGPINEQYTTQDIGETYPAQYSTDQDYTSQGEVLQYPEESMQYTESQKYPPQTETYQHYPESEKYPEQDATLQYTDNQRYPTEQQETYPEQYPTTDNQMYLEQDQIRYSDDQNYQQVKEGSPQQYYEKPTVAQRYSENQTYRRSKESSPQQYYEKPASEQDQLRYSDNQTYQRSKEGSPQQYYEKPASDQDQFRYTDSQNYQRSKEGSPQQYYEKPTSDQDQLRYSDNQNYQRSKEGSPQQYYEKSPSEYPSRSQQEVRPLQRMDSQKRISPEKQIKDSDNKYEAQQVGRNLQPMESPRRTGQIPKNTEPTYNYPKPN